MEDNQNPILWKEQHTVKKFCCSGKNDFFRSSRLSIDGKLYVTSTESNFIEYYEIASSVVANNYYYGASQPLASDSDDALKLATRCFAGDTLYDFQLHQSLLDDAGLPLTVLATRDHPVHLMEPATGHVRASYVPINHLDELDLTMCVAFNSSGEKIYTGSDRKIRSFDVAVPGRNCTEFWTSESKKAFFGQKGLISCISFNPDYSGVYAAGSFAGDVSVYAENSGSQSFFDIVRLGYGVSSIKWSPCGRYLWVGGRNSTEVTCWDVRGAKKQVGKIARSMATNQRNYFDVDPWGQYVLTGDDSGKLLCYSAKTFDLVAEVDTSVRSSISSCHFHPYSSIILACQGERTFTKDVCDQDGSDSDTSEAVSEPVDENDLLDSRPTKKARASVSQIENTNGTNADNGKMSSEYDILAVLEGKRRSLAKDSSDYQGGVDTNPGATESRARKPTRSVEDISPESCLLVYTFQKANLSLPIPSESSGGAQEIQQTESPVVEG